MKIIIFLCIDPPANEYLVDRGFDAQVNGAMISVPSFREKFG